MKFNQAFVLLFSMTSMVGLATIFGSQLVSPQLVSANSLKPKKIIFELAPAKSRTGVQMSADNAKSARRSVVKIPFRSGVSLATLKSLKARSAQAVSNKKVAPKSATGTKIPVVTKNCAGLGPNGFSPPDTHGAVGATQFVTVTNSKIAVYPKGTNNTCPLPVKNVSLNAFYGYTGATSTTIFDPRVIYDSTWKRWVVSAEAFPEAGGPTAPQYHFIAVSQTSNANGAYWIYQFNVNFFSDNVNNFWDNPKLGQTQDAVLLTANRCGASCGSAFALGIAKAKLYNGLGWSIPIFTGLQYSLVPPIVLDQSARAFFVSAPVSGSNLVLYGISNLQDPNTSAITSGPTNVPVTAYNPPAVAKQFGSSITLDSSDSRFSNASVQLGSSLWNTHTIGFPLVKWYEINTSSNTVPRSGLVFESGPSNDFNSSIVANTSRDLFLTWTATDPTPGTGHNASVKAASSQATGCTATSCSFVQTTIGTPSPTFLADFTCSPTCRWGDYSAVTIDPANSTKAWVFNEKVTNTTTWGTGYGNIIGF